MGKQKRNPARGSKTSTAVSSSVTQSATGEAASGFTSPQPESSVPLFTIKLEYERALDAVKSGSHTEALKLMKELVSRHKNSAHSAAIYRFQSTIYDEVAQIIDDPIAKQRHMKKAIESARNAVELSPCSLEFAHFYAKLLFLEANDWDGYEQVVKACERALGISDPIDPAKQSSKYEGQQELSTAEARIAHVQNKLQKLIRSSNLVVSSSGSGQRQKSGGHVRKEAVSTSESRDLVCSYWKSMSIDSKKEFHRIQVSDLRSHFESSKDTIELNDLLAEALSYAEANNKTWKYWHCCYCLNRRFSDSESITQHVRNKFVGNLLPEMQSVLPQNVEGDWIKKIPNYSWKPLDASAALKMLEDKAKSEAEESNITEGIEVDWPLSDDSERAKLLEKIHAAFNTLITRDCLAASHLNHVIKISMEEIQELAARSQLMNQRLDLSPTCICFLEAPQLKTIRRFLEEMCDAYDKGKNLMYDFPNISQSPEIKENISLDEDASCLVLDECFVPAEISPGATDPFLSWIFSGSSCRDELDSSKKRKEYRRTQAIELVHTIREEFNYLKSLVKMKYEEKNYEEALQIVKDLCVEGNNFTELDQRSYGSVLKRRKEELTKGENDAVHVNNRFEVEAITDVLKEARAMNANQSGEDDEERIKDIYIEKAIQKLKEDPSLELGIADAQFMSSVKIVKQLELKLDPATACDFRETLLPIVKSYLRARLEDLAEKEATKKSDASAEAFLAELDLEASQQDVAKAQESDKKTKDKGKKKQKGKTENLKKKKATYDHEMPTIEETTSTPGSSSGVPVHDDDKVKDHAEKQEEDELGLRVKELEQETTELLQKLQNPELGEEEKRKLTEELNQKLELQTHVANEASLMQQGWQQV